MNDLIQFATVRQIEYIEAIKKHGSVRKAAKLIGISHQSILRSLNGLKARAAKQDPKQHDYTKIVPEGFAIKGVSQYIDKDGKVAGQWVKTNAEQHRIEEIMREFVSELCQEIKGTSPKIEPPKLAMPDLLACYPIGDHHYGMRSDADETGTNYDCKIATQVLESAFDYLTSIAPPAETALMINLGDFQHTNDATNETPGHGNRLDVDSRFGKVLHSGGMTLVRCVFKLLAKHKKVIVWMMPGNHDPDVSMALAMAISFYFHNEPRVEVDMGRSMFKYKRFGENLIASTHGNGPKSDNLPLIMATDRPEDWFRSKYRVWHCGHIHHKTYKEHPGCSVEHHRPLAPGDAWAHDKGYRAQQDMNTIIYHSKHGEIQRTRFDMGMIKP